MLTRPDHILRWDVLEEHLDEACFLWTQWERSLESPLHTLEEVARGDEGRMRAHLVGLAAGGWRVAERMLKPVLEQDDAERIRAAGFALLLEGQGMDLDTVMKAFMEGSEPQRSGLRRALQLSEQAALNQHLLPLLRTGEPAFQAVLLEVVGFRRLQPGPALPSLLQHEVPAVRAAALRAARHCLTEVSPAFVRQALDSPEPMVREAALEVGLLLGLRAAWTACQRMAELKEGAGRLARAVLAFSGEASGLERLLELLEVPALRRDVLWALGFSGRMLAAEACLEWMDEPVLAGVAAEAFCAMTGLALVDPFARERDRDGPEEPIALEDEDLDADLHPGPDAALLLPEPESIRRWWAQARQGFEPGARYLGGKPFELSRLMDALEQGPMRRRATWALELSIRSRGMHQVETRAFSSLQRKQLGQIRAQRTSFSMTSFAAWLSR